MKHFTKATLLAVLSVLALTFVVCFAGCKNVKPKTDTYYLSTSSSEWKTYDTASSVPSSVLFAKNGDVYNLTVELDADEQISVNKVGSGAVAVELFSTRSELVAADDNRFTATLPGTYALSLEVEGDLYTLDYDYSAPVESVSIDTAVTTLGVGETYTFVATVHYVGGAEGHDVVWASSDPSVFTVSADGEVEAIAEGSAELSATAGSESAKVTITVSDAPAVPSSIKLNYEEVIIDKSATIQLTATVLPENVPEEDKDIIWQTNNSTVATVGQDGLVRATSTSGEAKITAKLASYASIVAECVVKVREPVTGISTAPAVDVVIGTPQLVAVTFQPTNATVHDISATVVVGEQYVKAEEDPATHGVLLTGLEEGEAEVLVTSEDNPEAICNFSVTVHPEGYVSVVLDVTDFTFNWSKLNQKQEVHATVSGSVEASTYTWLCSDNIYAASSGNTYNSAFIYPNGFGVGTLVCSVKLTDGRTIQSAPVTVTVTADTFYLIGFGGDYSKGSATEENTLVSTSENVYELTRHFNVNDDIRILYTGMSSGTADWWDYGMMGGRHLNWGASSMDYVNGSADNIFVKQPGTYKVTLNLNESVPQISVNLVSLDVMGVNVAVKDGQPKTLKVGEDESTILQATITPAEAKYELSDISWSVSTANSAYLKLEADGLTCNVSIAEGAEIPENGVTVTITCKIGTVSGTYNLQIMPEGVQKVPVSEINFAQDHYTKSITTTSASGWTQTVKATVNSDATVQGVTYSTSESSANVTVNSSTGVVTAKMFGTYTIKATSNDDPDKSATTRVTFYPAYMNLQGDHNGWPGTSHSSSNQLTEVEGSDKTIWEIKDVAITTGQGFKIWWTSSSSAEYFWSSRISDNYLSQADSYKCTTSADNKVVINETGKYDIRFDLSDGKGKLIVKLAGTFEMTEDFTTTVAVVLDGGDYSTNLLVSASKTFKPTSDDMTITLTIDSTVGKVQSLLTNLGKDYFDLCIVIGGDKGIWSKNAPANFTIDGDKFSDELADGKFTLWDDGNGGFTYHGTLTADEPFKFTFTITLNGDHSIKSVSID